MSRKCAQTYNESTKHKAERESVAGALIVYLQRCVDLATVPVVAHRRSTVVTVAELGEQLASRIPP